MGCRSVSAGGYRLLNMRQELLKAWRTDNCINLYRIEQISIEGSGTPFGFGIGSSASQLT